MIKEKAKPISMGEEKVIAPKFKGKAKFEIFENGKKVAEHIDTNMMTNMLQRVFNPKRLFVDRLTVRDLYINHMPEYSTVLGGLLLYEHTIDEDPNISLAPISNKCIGHAGGTYGGAQNTRGTLNEAESGFINPDEPWKGYRYVFDFGTDKANGTISCACLTSRTGGNSGYGNGIDYTITEDNNQFMAAVSNLSSISFDNGLNIVIKNYDSILDNKTFAYLGTTDEGVSRFAYLSSTQNLVYLELCEDKLGLTDLWNTEVNLNYYGREIDFNYLGKDRSGSRISQHDLPFVLPSATRQSTFVMNGKYYIVSHTSGTAFSYTVFDPVTRSFSSVENRTVSPAYGYSIAGTVCKAGEYWFAINGTNVIRYPEAGGTGENVGTLPFSPAASDRTNFHPMGSENLIFIGSQNNPVQTNYIKIFNASEPSEYFAKINTLSPSTHVKPQIADDAGDMSVILFYYIYPTTVSSIKYLAISFFAQRLTGYLATINNLSTPVTKTSGQTMKVTYEIIPEGEEG